MPKKKRKRAPSNKSLFKDHPNLKWLLPLLIIVFLGLLILRHQKEENERENPLKQEVRNILHLRPEEDGSSQSANLKSSPAATPNRY